MPKAKRSSEDLAIRAYQRKRIANARNARPPTIGSGVTRTQADKTLGKLAKSGFRIAHLLKTSS